MNFTRNVAPTAQRRGIRAKRTKKLSKRVVLYVPDTFDPDVHLPEEMRHLADYARYLLHRINVGRVHLRLGNCLVYLKHEYLATFKPRDRFVAIREALIESGVIHVRKFCVPGELCYGYRGTDHRIGSNFDQMSGSAESSGSKRIFEVVYFAVWFRGRSMTGE